MSEESRGSVQLHESGHTQWSDEAAEALLTSRGYEGPRDKDIVTLYDDLEVVAAGRNGALNTVAPERFFESRVFIQGSWRVMHYRPDGSHWIDDPDNQSKA